MPITSVDKILRVRMILEGSPYNRDQVLDKILDDIGDLPDTVSVDCQKKHWMDGDGTVLTPAFVSY